MLENSKTAQLGKSFGGSLADRPLKQLLVELTESAGTGVLRFDGAEIWFEGGGIYLVSTVGSPPLADVLFNADVGSLGSIDARFDSDAADGSVVDQLTVEYPGQVKQLGVVLREFNLGGMLELLVPRDSEFEIVQDEVHKLGAALKTDAATFVSQATQRLEIWRKIATSIPSAEAVFELNQHLPDGKVERVTTADEWKFLSLLNGQNNIADLVHKTGESAFRVTASVYKLWLEGVISEQASQ